MTWLGRGQDGHFGPGAVEFGGLVAILPLGQSADLLFDGLFAVAGIGVVGDKLQRAGAAGRLEFFEEMRQLDGIVAGFRH